MTYIAIDLESKVAPFEQIKSSIMNLMVAGDLAEGRKLPTIRQLAGDLSVAPNTVARAYRELEADGLVRSRGRRGTVVLGLPVRPDSSAVAANGIVQAVVEAKATGMSAGEILATVTHALS